MPVTRATAKRLSSIPHYRQSTDTQSSIASSSHDPPVEPTQLRTISDREREIYDVLTTVEPNQLTRMKYDETLQGGNDDSLTHLEQVQSRRFANISLVVAQEAMTNDQLYMKIRRLIEVEHCLLDEIRKQARKDVRIHTDFLDDYLAEHAGEEMLEDDDGPIDASFNQDFRARLAELNVITSRQPSDRTCATLAMGVRVYMLEALIICDVKLPISSSHHVEIMEMLVDEIEDMPEDVLSEHVKDIGRIIKKLQRAVNDNEDPRQTLSRRLEELSNVSKARSQARREQREADEGPSRSKRRAR